MSSFGAATFGSGTFGAPASPYQAVLMTVNPDTLQPYLPAPVPFTEIELNYADEEPHGLFPDNQDSNWGFLRKIFCDILEEFRGQLDMLYAERFVKNADVLLPVWESEYALPVNPTGKTKQQRRDEILNRLRVGAFTNARRQQVVESYFTSSSGGSPIQLLPAGVDLSVNPQIFGEPIGALSTVYRIYQDVKNFHYDVWVLNTTSPDITAMTRELKRITPAGISFTIDNSKVNILDFEKALRNYSPLAHWRLGNLNDVGPYGYTLTAVGTAPTVLAAPGLLVSPVDATNGAYTFSGANGLTRAIGSAAMIDKATRFTFGAIVRGSAFTASS